MARPRVKPLKPKILKRPEDMHPITINGVISDPWLPREAKLAILVDLIKHPDTTTMEKRSCIEAHSILAGDTKESQTFVLKIESYTPDEIKSIIESRITKPLIPDITK